MKKNVLKLISLMLVLSMVILMGGCSAKSKLIGSWETELDLTDMMNAEIGNSEDEMSEYFVVENFAIRMVLTFNEDDTYTMTVDEASVEAAMASFKTTLTNGLENYFKDMLAQMGMEDASVSDLLASMGVSMEELVGEVIDAFMEEDMFSELNSEGNFKAEDGKLYLSDGTAYGVDENEYENYTLENGVLTLVSCVTADELTEMEEMIYPITFTKVAK